MLSTALRIVIGLLLVVISLFISTSSVFAQQTFTNNLSDSDTQSPYTLQSRIAGPFKTSDTVHLTGSFTQQPPNPQNPPQGVPGQSIKIEIRQDEKELCNGCRVTTATGSDVGAKEGDFGYNIDISSLGLEAGQSVFVTLTTETSSKFLSNQLSFVVEGGGGTPGNTQDPGSTEISGGTDRFNTQGGIGSSTLNSSYGPLPHTSYTLENVLDTFAGCFLLSHSLGGGDDLPTDGCASRVKGKLTITTGGTPSGGGMGVTTKVLAILYNNPPTSSREYLADLGSNLGIVDTAYAQGVGGSGDGVLKPILNLWKVFRNLAYLGFILVFIIVGFMIMFRQRLNPQTVVTMQSAIPGLVIGLILVTFSYFLSALIVDLSFIGMKLVAYIFSTSSLGNIVGDPSGILPGGIGPTNQGIQTLAEEGNIFGMWWAFINNPALQNNIIYPLTQYFNTTEIIAGLFGSSASEAVNNQGFLSNIINLNLGAVVAQGVGAITSGIGYGLGFFISAIVVIALFIQLIRLLWGLISAYITILLFTIFSPIIIAIGSIPGRGGVISYWWKTLLGNVLIFPAVFFVFLFAGSFLAEGNVADFQNTLPLFSGIQIPVLKAIIGYGLVLGSPAVPGLVKQALGVKDITAIQQAAFAGGAAGFNMGKAPVEYALKPIAAQRQAYREQQLRERFTAEGATPAEREASRKQLATGKPWLTWFNRM